MELESMDWTSLLSGKPFTHKGSQYHFSADESESTRTMLPSSEGTYEASPVLFTRSYSLKRDLTLPQISTSSPCATTPSVKQKRQQPEGLRQRFRPIGDAAESPIVNGKSQESRMDSSLSTPSPKVHFKKPPVPLKDDLPQSSPKRKRDETDAERAARKAAKKARKEAKVLSSQSIQESSQGTGDISQNKDHSMKDVGAFSSQSSQPESSHSIAETPTPKMKEKRKKKKHSQET